MCLEFRRVLFRSTQSSLKWVRNLAVVWMLTGLWHGAAWNFVLWGALYGALLFLEKQCIGRILEKYRLISRLYFIFFTMLGFVIFNANGLQGILSDFQGLFGLGGLPLVTSETLFYLQSFAPIFLAAVVGATPLFAKLATKYRETTVFRSLEPIGVAVLLCIVTADRKSVV